MAKENAGTKKATAGSIGIDGHGRLTSLVERNNAAPRAIADREIAARNLARTVTPTSLVAETVVRLMRQRKVPQTVPHLCGLSTILMGQALTDRIRKSKARNRNGGQKPLPLPEDLQDDRRSALRSSRDPKATLLRDRLLEALQRLAGDHPRDAHGQGRETRGSLAAHGASRPGRGAHDAQATHRLGPGLSG